jgi:SAM-dependent methyltransferase
MIPAMHEYFHSLESPIFRHMEEFSNNWLVRNAERLKSYPWSKDPFHQWSRQWEYPWVFKNIVQSPGQKILDAGSGITFFPDYLRSWGHDVTCLDSDPKFSDFATVGSIQSMPFPDHSFDIVVCISVLEHTENYGVALEEFRRVLKPGGKLLLTFDYCLDGEADIPAYRVAQLRQELNRVFDFPLYGQEITLPESPLTTKAIAKWDRNLLPWKISLVKKLKWIVMNTIIFAIRLTMLPVPKEGKVPYFPLFPELTVVCELVA